MIEHSEQLDASPSELQLIAQAEFIEASHLGLPHMEEAAAIGFQITTGMITSERPLQVRPPRPGQYATRDGERLSVHELLPSVDTWLSESEGSARFVIQGGNRYISDYLRHSDVSAYDLKIMSIDKAPLYVQLNSLLSAAERQAPIDPDIATSLGQSIATSRQELLATFADFTLSSPFTPITKDEQLAAELLDAVRHIQANDLPVPHHSELQLILRDTQFAKQLQTPGDLHFIDDLFYRGRTLYSLAVMVKIFGGDIQRIRLTTLACDPKSTQLSSPYHRVLDNQKLYPFENSIRTEQGYWQDTGDTYLFTDMANYWEYLNERVDPQQSIDLYTEWQEKLEEWSKQTGINETVNDASLAHPLLWLYIYHQLHGIPLTVDKIVDQKGYKIGASVPFMQLIDRFISQEEPVEARLAFKQQIRQTLEAITRVAQKHSASLAALVAHYETHQYPLDYHGLSFMFEPDTVVAEATTTLEYAAVTTKLAEYIQTRAQQYGRPYIVGISGVDTSGKSQLCAAVAEALRHNDALVAEVHVDNFTQPHAHRHGGTDTIDNYYNRTFDIDTLKRQLLRPIMAGALPQLVLHHVDPRDDTKLIEHAYDISGAPSIVLVEGVFLYRPELQNYFDDKIFLDMPLSMMRDRAILRDVPKFGFSALKKYPQKYIPAQEQYLTSVRPQEIADIVIDMSDWKQPKIIAGEVLHGDS